MRKEFNKLYEIYYGTTTNKIFFVFCVCIISLSLIFQEMNMGQRCSDTRGITFEDVVIPKEVNLASYIMYTWGNI